MDFIQRAQKRKNSELRIIGAISIDLNGVSDELRLNEVNEETRMKVAHTILKEFCSNSTVHGVRYFTEQNRHWVERIWWLIAITLSMALCAQTMFSIWMKWHERPVIVSFDDKTTPIGMIPFPAITICSTEKILKHQVGADPEQYINTLMAMETNRTAYKNLSPEHLNRLDAIMHVCSKEITKLADGLIIPRTEPVHKTIEELGPEQSSVVIFSTFGGQFVRFKPIFTGEGLCFTFNSLNSAEIYTDQISPDLMTVEDNPNAIHWNMEEGYKLNINDDNVYPYRVFDAGSRDILGAVLGILFDEIHKICSELMPGFRLSLHTPDELPQLPDDFLFIPIEQEVYISVKPNVIATSETLRRYPPQERGCFFKSERHLRFFKSYSQQNCESECVANFTKRECGCVKFSMPRDKETAVCTLIDIRCYINARDNFSKELMVKKCDCLPDCTSITYDVEISQAQSRYSDTFLSLKNAINESNLDLNSKVFISYKEHSFISINRTEAYTFPDFIASCGGLLGLFMGVSMLSVVELIYYFTLRLCCRLKHQKARKIKAQDWNKRNHFAAKKNKNHRRRF